ncbi:MAG: tetratricopeptide repeat protein, partial [Rhodothermales bacterium]|nr:tetratricopeptide repeat protein [Rhodothermales bacterium]
MQIPDIRSAKRRLSEGSPDDARAVLQRMLDEMPDHAAARVLMARSYERQSRWASAALHWSVAARLCPTLPHVQSAAAEATLRAAMDVDYAPAPRTVESDAPPSAIDAPTADLESSVDVDVDVDVDTGTADAPDVRGGDWTDEAAPAGGQPASASEYEDLDHLIEELEDARIVPDPEVEVLPEDELRDDIDDVVSET